MKNPIGFGLAILATASLAAAHGEGDGKDGKDSPLLDNLFQQGTKVSYKPGGGVTFDGGEEFRMNIRGRIQIFWQYADFDNVANPAGDTPSDLNTFGLRRARTNFRGHVFSEDVTYYLQNSHEGGTSIKDATIGWRFMNSEDYSINLRLGLHKLRSGLQQDGSSSRLEFPERSAASNTFAGRRGAGALFEGAAMKDDGDGKLQWGLSAYNNDLAGGAPGRDELANESTALNYGIHLMWNSAGGKSESHSEGDLDHSGDFDWLVGGNVHFINDRYAGVKDEGRSINVFGAIKTGAGIAAQGEFWARSDEDPANGAGTDDSTGWYVQGSYTTAPGEGTQYGFAARLGMVDLESANGGSVLEARGSQLAMNAMLDGFTDGSITDGSLAVNAYYHKHMLKAQFAYTYMKTEPTGGPDSTNHGLEASFLLLF